MNIGLDVGYSHTKAISDGRRVTFPSAVGTPDKARFSLAGDAGAIILVDPNHVQVGAGAVQQSRFLHRREDRSWIESDEWYALFLAALTELTQAKRVEMRLVTGLPVVFYEDRRREWAQTPLAVQEFVLALVTRVQELEAEVSALCEQDNRNSRNSSKPPSSDGPGVPPKPRKRAKGKRKRGGQPGHKGTTRKLVPIEQVKDRYDIKPETCKCGHALRGQDPQPHQHQVTEIPPVVAEVVEYRLHVLSCPQCGTETCAELPAGVPQGAFGPRLQAMVSLLGGCYHLSKRDTEEVMDDFFRADISVGSVCALEQRTGGAIREPVEEAREYVKEQPMVHMDETGWREANKKAWLWVAVTFLVTVFLIR